MYVTMRSYLTTGIAALSAGAIAITPLQPIPTQVNETPQRAVENLAVNLAASIDPITPWVNAFETAGANIETLTEFYMQKPFPLLQTVVANLGTYAEELENGQGNLIPEQIWNNVKTFFEAPWSPGAQITLTQADIGTKLTAPVPLCDAPSSCSQTTQVAGQSSQDLWLLFYQVVGGISAEDPLTNGDLPALTIWNTIVEYQQAVNFLFTPYSGQVLGALGPLLSPVVQLTKSFTAVGKYFQDGDVTAAINELINIPANMTNAFLNGAGFWDLTPIVEAIIGGPIPDVEPYLTPNLKLGLNLGGLLNAVPKNGSIANPIPDFPPPVRPTEWFGIGFDGLSIRDTGKAFFGPEGNIVYGYPNGLGGAAIALGQYLSEELLVKPPTDAQTASAVETSPVEVAAPFTEDAPAPADATVESPAPVAKSIAVIEAPADEAPTPAVEDIAEVAAVPEVEDVVEIAEDPAPVADAVPTAGDSGIDAGMAIADQSDSNTGRAGGENRRGDK